MAAVRASMAEIGKKRWDMMAGSNARPRAGAARGDS